MLDIDNVHPFGYCPVDSCIDVVNNVAVVLGDVVLNVDNDKCFRLHTLKDKTTWIKVAVETAIEGGELQHAVVGIGYARRIVLLVALTPNHLLALSVCQHLHCATKHHTLETFASQK